MEKKKIHLNEFTGKHFHFDNSFWNNPLPCGFISLFQIGELCCVPDFRIEEHEQDVYEITYVISGSGFAYVDGNCEKISEGDIMINSTGHKHSIVVDKTSIFRFAYIGFVFNDTEADADVEFLKSFYNKKAFYVGKCQNNILYPFMRCIDEFYSQSTCSNDMIKSYCRQIVIMAARNFSDASAHTLDHNVKRDSVCSAVYAIIKYVEDNIDRIGSIKDLSEHFGYNYTYLSHFFKDKTGITLQQYICYKKVEFATQLLKDMTPSQVSERLHYESLSSFSKSFRRVMGVSPRQYIVKELMGNVKNEEN